MLNKAEFKKWNDFKNLIVSLKPDIIFFWKEMHPLRKPPIGLRFDFYHKRNLYIFIDFADGEKMWKTEIPVYSKNKEGHVDDKEIIHFLSKQFRWIKIVSMGCFSID